MENRVITFRHCEKDIYCFNVPEECPICGQSLAGRGLDDAPVCIPNCFVDGHHEKCSFLIKPTQGSFLREYDGKDDLHVAISNTHGVVYNYIETGVQRDDCGWEECISVPLVQPDMYNLINQWDIYLEQFSTADVWLPNRYNEYEHNCYSYALTFINRVLVAQSKRQLSRTEFTEREYDGKDDLHVAISNTHGVVYNYIETGVQRDDCGWEECISVPLVQPDMYNLINQWDIYLEQFSTADVWLPNRYNEYEHNCYSYALTFINRVLVAQSKRQLSRTEFTERFVVPRTKRASKYITLYRELCRNYFYIADDFQTEEVSSQF